ncbi:CDGSH iron-sulfur domain-containing protein [Streptomyces hoynatensis]|uniref:CDGSH iron-sulfur domain-containing protein n=1 Tax=Streptomyces hoynatensis TaxID=1141874 RepID=UPI001F4F0830|nr:CDGSH iron-sulfur domain-containing protein [Streptomyces hoynatensis]
MSGRRQEPEPRRVTIDPRGPLLIEGPVEVVLADGRTVRSDRFLVAVCTCRRSRAYPWCDTSHRRRSRPPSRRAAAGPGGGEEPQPGAGAEEAG